MGGTQLCRMCGGNHPCKVSETMTFVEGRAEVNKKSLLAPSFLFIIYI